MRPGTENTPMIVGLGAAADLVTANLRVYSEHMAQMRGYLREQLIRKFRLMAEDHCGGPLKAGEVRFISNYQMELRMHRFVGEWWIR